LKKFPDDFLNKIICGDCLEIMKKIPDKGIDFIFTSPPYKDKDVIGNYWGFYEKFINEISRITKDYAFVFHSSVRLIELIKKFKSPFRILIWNKVFTQTAFRWEPILIYKFTEEYSINKFLWKDIFSVVPIRGSEQVVPYENPLKLYSLIISRIPENKIILDPFCGSGTTAMACKNLHRNFIGIEINKDYCKIAEDRLRQGVL